MANNTINYQVNFSTNLDNLQSQMKKFATDLGKINPDSASKLDTVIARLEKSFGNLHEKMSKPITSQGQYSAIKHEVESITADFRALSKEYAHLASLTREEKLKLLPDDYSKQLALASEALAKFEKEQRRISKMSADISDKSARLTSLEKKRTSYSDKISTTESKRRGEQASLYKNDLDAINQQIAALKKLKETRAAYDKAAKSGEKVDRRKKLVGKDGSEYNLAGARAEVKKAFGNTDMAKLDSSELRAEIKRLEGARTETERKIAEPSFSKKEQAELEGYRQVVRDTTSEIDKLTKSIEEDNAAMASQKTEQANAAFMELYNTLQGLGVNLDGIDPKLGYTKDGFDLLRQKVEGLTDEQLAKLNSILSQSGDAAQQAGIGIRQLGEDSERAGKELEQAADRSSRLGEISTYARQFLGFTGAINIAHNAINKATNSIKELDKTMTQMAVVTDLDIGDYWNQIPTYTKRANELGVSIDSVYEADMLLFQQGLKTKQVVEISTEALKMARIAGLDAEEATNRLTSAIRGFGMELDKTSAQRVSDVYSELAAISASDVNELSTAMSKTASIASSAGASFENTSAFLAQMIETTREAPDAIGTSLKTVVARFTELKKAPSEIGEVDGEIVDANAIETALRSVGIALRDEVTGQLRDFDDIILELAAKWDTLDSNTQHYIATVSAGSRQQSRFLALLSDYDRLLELTTAAEGATGASEEQYQKTLDSLESKLAKLDNAWTTFTTTIVNSDLYKGAIDLLSYIVNAINNITSALDGNTGIAKIGLLIGALKTGDVVIKSFSESWKKGGSILESVGAGFKKVGDSAKKTAADIKRLVKGNYLDIDESNKIKEAIEERISAQKDLAIADAEIDDAKKRKTYNEQTQIDLDEKQAEAKERLVKAEAAETAARTLSTKQQKESLAMQQLGVAADKADIFAKQGITAKNIELAASVYGVTAAEVTEEQARKIGNASLLKKIHLTIMSKIAEGTKTKGTWLNKLAQDALNGSLLASLAIYGLLVVAIVAVVVVIWLVVKAYKAMQAQMPTAKLKGAQAATQAAADAATEAAAAYDNLNDSLSALSDKYSTLENLTKGTDKWKTATNEINKEVMNLIDEYKELAQYATYEDGVMKIDIQSDEVQEVLQEKEVQATNAKIAEQTSKIQEMEYQADVDVMASDIMKEKQTKQLIGSIAVGVLAGAVTLTGLALTVASAGTLAAPALAAAAGVGVAVGMLHDEYANLVSQEKLEKRAKLFSNESLYIDKDGEVQIIKGKESEFEDLALELGFTDTRDALSSLSSYSEEELQELQELGENYRKVAEYEKSINEIIRGQMKDLINTQTKTKSENAVIDTLSKNETVTARYQAEALEEVKAMNNAEFIKKMREIYGETFKEEDGKYYVDDTELTDVTKESLQAQAASVIASHKVADALEKVAEEAVETAKKIDNLNKKDAFTKLFSKDEGAALTESTMDEASAIGWTDLGTNTQNYFGSEEAYTEWRNEQIDLAKEALQTAQNRMNRALGVSDFEFIDKDVEVGALSGLSAKVERIGYASGSQGVNEVMSLVDSLTEDMTGEQKTILYNQLAAFDWNDKNAWDDLPKTLEAIGVSIPLDVLDDFITKTSTLAQAVYKVDFSKLVDSLTETAKVIKDIRSGATDRTIDESTYEQLIKSDADLAKQFIRNLDGEYVYLGSSMDDLADCIEVLTTEAARISREGLGEQIKIGNYLESDEGELSKIALRGFVERNGFQQDEARKLKNLVINVLENSGIIDYSKLGIEGFTNNTNLDKVFTSENKEFAMEIVSAIFGYATNLAQNKASAETYDIQIAATDRQLKDASLNQGATKGSSEALVAQATTAGVNSKIIDEYRASLEKYNKMSNKSGITADLLKKRIQVLEKQMVHSTNVINRDANITTAIESIDDLAKKYESAASEAQKFAIAGQMASNFNLKVTKDNYEELGKYLSNYASGDYNSFMALIQESADQASVSIGSINATTWTEAVLDTYPVYEDFFDMLITRGAGAFDANHKWIWTTKQEFEAIAKEAGANIWENTYDWIYNYTEQVNALTREREKLERKFERTLENEVHTAAELRDITLDEVDALKRRARMSGDAALKVQKETQALFGANSKYSDYLVYNQQTGAITANYPALNQNKNEEFGDGFEKFIDKLEELRDTYQDAVDDLEDIEDELSELSKRGREEYSDLIDQVQEALIQSYQDIIDERSSVSEAIKDAQDTIVNSMQEQINATRQARENDKTTSDLEDRRLRLAALMRDTSGGNAVEIAKLQKELTEAEESYTDTLVDQALERLQDANEKAAEQRDKQIELAQAQLDAYSESSVSFDDAQNLLNESLQSISPDAIFGEEFMSTAAGKLLSGQREAMNKVAKEDWVKELQEGGSLAKLYAGYHDDIQGQIDKTQEEIDEYKKEIANIDTFLGNEEITKRLQGNEPYSIKLEEDSNLMQELSKIGEVAEDISGQLGEILVGEKIDTVDSVTIITGQAAYKGYSGSNAGSVTFTPYATGGLADFTGPAWLDGTPTRPEMVLNPQDTANFIVLKDILSDILVGASSTTNATKSGDNYYDIAINVDSISDDYDVEQMADKVRDMIYQDSIYRNVNTVNRVK